MIAFQVKLDSSPMELKITMQVTMVNFSLDGTAKNYSAMVLDFFNIAKC